MWSPNFQTKAFPKSLASWEGDSLSMNTQPPMKASVSKEDGCTIASTSVVTSAPSPDCALLASETEDAPEKHYSRRTSDCDGGNYATSKLKPSPAPLSDSRLNCPFGVSILHVFRADAQPARAPAGCTVRRIGCQLSSRVPNVYFLKAGHSRTRIFRLPPSFILKVRLHVI